MTSLQLGGIHHVTAVTGHAKANVDFYTQTLGLRLVKKTVNQDVTTSYHLFYGDAAGHPGTEMTFFDWPSVGSHVRGAGDISTTGFIVPNAESLEWWSARFDGTSVKHGPIERRNGHSVLAFGDPESQRLELIAGRETEAVPWSRSPVPAQHAIRGLASVTLTVRDIESSATFMERLLGFRRGDSDGDGLVMQIGPGGLGAEVRLVPRADLPTARVAIGGVHHVAFRTPDDAEHREWQANLAAAHVGVTDVIDRYYFRSIYFREPSGVLFEIATDGPGFTGDEDIEHLGERLSLPPFLEARRSEIEAQLTPLDTAPSRP